MAHKVCPWWLGYFLVNPLRRLVEHPVKLLQPFVRDGMLVLEPGCGMGFFTLDLARLVGASGRVVAVDLQPRMLAGLRRRAARAGLAGRIDARPASPDRLGTDDLAGRVDLALAIHVVHEVPDQTAFFAELYDALKPGGQVLVAEPRGHVSMEAFAATLEVARSRGLEHVATPDFASSRAALLQRGADPNPA
jgi:SAM-dependent methyltransferase